MISSAVLIPDEPQPEPEHLDREQSNPLKRRQSSVSVSSESSKRPRLNGRVPSSSRDTASSPPARRPSSAARSSLDGYPVTDSTTGPGQAMSPPPPRQQPEPRRRSAATGLEQDKSRNRRLFGALLGTLAQSARPSKTLASGTSATRNSRREEIENRQRERLKRENGEMAEQARRKRDELDRVRRIEQKLWDEEGLQIRHRNLRATARFLRTTTEPKLYYLPWELRPQEEETIKRQIKEVEALIQRETDEFNTKRQQEQVANGPVDQPTSRSPSITKQNGDVDMDQDGPRGRTDQIDGHHGGDNIPSAPKENTDRPHSPEDAPLKADADADVTTSDSHALQKHEDADAVRQKETDRPTSKEDDHGGEELEQGREDDVIY